LRVRQLRKAFMPRLSTGQSLAALLGRYASPSAAAKTVLQDITFDLWAGQALALIGRNGSGKSTLLKIINGSLLPDAGTIECRGRISALIELGAGFDPQASGRQNMAMQGALWGLSRQELADSVQRIIDFSELGPAIDEPVAHYSSGMLLRLAFSIAIAARADLLIVDEALAVGDVRFQQKCIAAVQAHLQRGGALLFVSHDLNSVKQLCDRALVIEDGHIIASGPPGPGLPNLSAAALCRRRSRRGSLGGQCRRRCVLAAGRKHHPQWRVLPRTHRGGRYPRSTCA
jgi:lipopolysaccharide transport system ATP-binding protein